MSDEKATAMKRFQIAVEVYRAATDALGDASDELRWAAKDCYRTGARVPFPTLFVYDHVHPLQRVAHYLRAGVVEPRDLPYLVEQGERPEQCRSGTGDVPVVPPPHT